MHVRDACRRALVVLAATGLVVGATGSPSSGAASQEPASQRRPGPPVPSLDWTDCGDGFQCANAAVPLDYRHPNGQTIEIALIRKPALDQANRIGSLFANPGGPGGSGIEFVRTAPPAAFQLLSRFDFVGFDPRGVGASRPAIDCGTEETPSFASFERPQTVDPAGFEARMRSIADACLANNAALLPHMSTANVARDLDLLRQGVGDEQLNYVGISYGSAIGAFYATLFPGRSRAMVIDSPMDVEGYVDHPVEFWQEHAAGFENTLDRFFTACAVAGPACGFGGTDPEAAFDALVSRLEAAPLPSPDPATLPPLDADLVLVAGDDLRAETRWPEYARALAAAEAGDPAPMYEFLGLPAEPSARSDAQTAVLAVDQRYDRRVAPYFDSGEHSYAMFDHFWWLGGYGLLQPAVWPVEDRGAFRGEIENPAEANPILVIGITYDPATPYVWAERFTADLGNARLLTYQSDGHGALTSLDPCLLGAFIGFINDLVLPPEGATCVDQRPRFPSETERTATSADAPAWELPRDIRI